ncbi:MAG TPA: hypothetical protein VFV33_18045, partial [Gemmatimonadaceae bacterium]|nr:hypothetical protein [Gemmatimonadaceae bacterium]
EEHPAYHADATAAAGDEHEEAFVVVSATSRAAAGASAASAAVTGAPTAPAEAPAAPRWKADAERELGKIPFFVRGKARRNTESYARQRGIRDITVDVLYDAKAHFGR